ncbi:phospho-N-acetylmuramoyl-pentapeptide undecaprenyl phosphate (C55P) transferase [Candidatus Hydrogenisulfobacillus filiaventi]|uniref:Phospho-N-acetylmuramoyl-pentapeptide-transferase n=1 Tax=Candidatus Hydrogenisulfobacillus filiaventi TaxID=2707344 RepID=A0A6F8ZFI6_9FIRM|nr:phospho-N-acetylmuramoyl-pentapeptide undecaprenyl phosphate (C55P) transferase [Candidatus Hydrogenisulfobacillus filiaventi]
MTMVWSGVTGLLLAMGLGPGLIPWLRRLKIGQVIREAGPETHLKKAGVPTMGGLLFLLPLPVVGLLWARGSGEAWALVLLAVGYGLIGFADDYLKVVRRRSLGLRAREKLAGQVLLAAAFVWYAHYALGADRRWLLPFGLPPIAHPGWWAPLVSVLAIIGTANAVNLTDGLDGLAGGSAAIAVAGLAVLLAAQGATAALVVALGLLGGLVGFLRFNLHPARLIMGDTGSLALGAALAGLAVVGQRVLFLPVVGILFVLEALSVILQVASYRWRGRRIFRMSPLHHHFELSGWSEERVVTVFWLIALAGTLLAWL